MQWPYPRNRRSGIKQKLVERELTEERPRRSGGAPSRRRRSVTVNLAESPLSWHYARGYLDDRQLVAGERLRTDYERAQLAPSATMRWDPVRAGTTGDTRLSSAERQIDAKSRFHARLRRRAGACRMCCGE